MAIYRLEAKAISRGQGRSCVAAASYRHAEILADERQGLTHDYSRKGGVIHSEIIAPGGAPDWAQHREWLWNHLDKAEKRRDAITAREVLLTLPRELDQDRQVELVRSFVRERFTARGIIADIAIHTPHALDGEAQPHAHVMLADRVLDPAQPNSLAARKDTTLSRPEGIVELRQAWESHANSALERAGLDQRLDCRSLAVQAQDALKRSRDQAQPEDRRSLALADAAVLDRDPEPKIGPVAMRMHRQGRGDQAYALKRAQEAREARSVLERARTCLRKQMAVLEPWRAFWGDLAQGLVRRVADKERHAREWLGLPHFEKLSRAFDLFDHMAAALRRPAVRDIGTRHAGNPDLHEAIAEGYRQAEKPGEVAFKPPLDAAETLEIRLENRIRAFAGQAASMGDDTQRRIWNAVAGRAQDTAVKDAWLKYDRALDPRGEEARDAVADLIRTGMRHAGIAEPGRGGGRGRGRGGGGPSLERSRDRGPDIEF